MTDNSSIEPGRSVLDSADGHNDKKIVIALFFFSLLARVVYVVFFNVNRLAHAQNIFRLRHDDQGSFWQFAAAVLEDKLWLTSHISFRPPLYPLFLALIASAFGTGKNFIAIMLVQCVIGSFSVLFIYFIAKTVFNRQTAALSASWAAVYPLFLYYCGFLLAETMVIFLFLFFVLSVLMFLRREKLLIMAGSGILYALLIHADPRFLFHFPFVFFYLYIGLADLKKTVKPFIMLSLIALLCSVPWAVRNHFTYKDRFVLINTRTLDMWAKRTVVNVNGRTGDEQNSEGNAKPKSLEQFEEWKRKTLTEHPGDGRETPGDNEGKKGPAWKISQGEISAFENGARPSFSIPGLYLHHFLEFWRFARFTPGYDPYPDLRFESKWGRDRNLIGIAFTGVLLPSFAAGIFFCVKRRSRFGLLLCAIMFTHMLLHMIVHSRERYRMPIEGFIFMVAFYVLREIVAKFKMYTKSGERYEASQG